ncbi:hypothetical protein [Microvirgula aerodenitrificans]|uniref:hypothetical protein n=1 Tax=Microvirgula aerodenitrificans TaxID=57480 RepID=UPI00048B19CA|nr:hypothetical protein [Microvirgula aerodenitrificans]
MNQTAETRPLRAALAVSALSSGDRAWLAGQLTPDERLRLDAVLGDLKGQSLPALAQVVDAALTPGQERIWLAQRLPALAARLALAPEALWPRLGAVLGTGLRQLVLQYRASDGTAAAARPDPLAASWTALPGRGAPALDHFLLQSLVDEVGRHPLAASPPEGRRQAWWPWRRRG